MGQPIITHGPIKPLGFVFGVNVSKSLQVSDIWIWVFWLSSWLALCQRLFFLSKQMSPKPQFEYYNYLICVLCWFCKLWIEYIIFLSFEFSVYKVFFQSQNSCIHIQHCLCDIQGCNSCIHFIDLYVNILYTMIPGPTSYVLSMIPSILSQDMSVLFGIAARFC